LPPFLPFYAWSDAYAADILTICLATVESNILETCPKRPSLHFLTVVVTRDGPTSPENFCGRHEVVLSKAEIRRWHGRRNDSTNIVYDDVIIQL